MSRKSQAISRLMLASVLGAAALAWNGNLPLDADASLLSSAEARIGRPLTPMSFAGVARRTTRRAIVGGAVVGGAVAAGAYYATPSCAQVVDAYGRVATVCR